MRVFDLGESEQSLPSSVSEKTTRKRASISMQSLRDVVNRISRPPLSAARDLANSEKKLKSAMTNGLQTDDDDNTSLKISKAPSRTSMFAFYQCIRRGLVVRISAFHAGGPGSIPGVGILFLLLSKPVCVALSVLDSKAQTHITSDVLFEKGKKRIQHTLWNESRLRVY